jgi:hypothetical protein
MRHIRQLLGDGDLGLLALIFVAGLIPLFADAAHGRELGVEATLGTLMCLFSAWFAVSRVFTHLRAHGVRQQLLKK